MNENRELVKTMEFQPLEFSPGYDNTEQKVCYREAVLKLDNPVKTHLRLLDIFFRPYYMLGDSFSKIFPKFKEDERHGHHSMITDSTGYFRLWNGWIFRGQSDEHLKSTFEKRIGDSFFKDKEYSRRDIFELEMGIVREFKRTAGTFYPELRFIDDRDTYEYMSWIRHFGGATRFIDVTHSFFIALFFAIGRNLIPASQDIKKRECYIWCFDKVWLERRYKDFLPDKISRMYKDLDEFGKDVRIQEAVLQYVPKLKGQKKNYKDEFLSVINMEPFYYNKRIVRQKGLFLMQTNPYRSFEDNLFNMIKKDCEDDSWHILKIKIEYDDETLILLHKFLDGMNINNSVLFENLEGICESMNAKPFFQNDSIVVPPTVGIRNSSSMIHTCQKYEL